jgi:PAS domain S-box-containing protein
MRLALAGGVGLAYFVAGRLGLGLALVNPSVTLLWAPTGIALAALLLLGRGLWPAILVAAFLVNASISGFSLTSLGIATGNALEAAVGSLLAERFAHGVEAFERADRVLAFAAAAGLCAPLLSATVGVASLCVGGFASWQRFSRMWLAWWAGDVGGALIVAPFLILWARGGGRRAPLAASVEAGLALAMTLGAALIAFGGWFPYAFVTLVPLFWASLRLGPRTAVTATLLLAIVAVSETLRGHGPFVLRAVEEPLLPTIGFLIAASVGALAVAALMSERRQSEQELRRLADIVASSEDAIVGARRDGSVTSWNAAAERLYGYSAQEMLGRRMRLGHRAEDTQRILARLAQGASVRAFDTTHPRKDGSAAQVSLSVSPVRDARGHVVGIASIGRDVSDRLRLTELREHAAGLTQEIQRIQESADQRSRFVSHVSHEFRTPLTAIVGFTDMLREGKLGPLSDLQRRCVQDITQSCEHLLRLVNDVLDLAQIDAGRMELRPEVVDVAAVVSDVTNALLPITTEKSIRVFADVHPSLHAELLDPGRLRQLLYNYLSNGLKFTPANGSIEVRAAPEGEEWLLLEVQDNGSGVPSDLQGRLFNEFERLGSGFARVQQGLGLGLAIVKRIVEAQGGSVGYRPAPGGGSVFSARLPRRLVREG